MKIRMYRVEYSDGRVLHHASVGVISASGASEFDALHALKRQFYVLAEKAAQQAFTIWKREQLLTETK